MNVVDGTPASSQCCVYCWPAFKPATGWDYYGYACCAACEMKPDRKVQAPAFLFRPLPPGAKLK